MFSTIKMVRVTLFILIYLLLSSCWAPRCPMETCKSKYEHKHNDQVSGIFRSRQKLLPEKIHFLWDKDKGETNPNTDLELGPGKKRIKGKKKFPWERW